MTIVLTIIPLRIACLRHIIPSNIIFFLSLSLSISYSFSELDFKQTLNACNFQLNPPSLPKLTSDSNMSRSWFLDTVSKNHSCLNLFFTFTIQPQYNSKPSCPFTNKESLLTHTIGKPHK